jgi:hypothetical protein
MNITKKRKRDKTVSNSSDDDEAKTQSSSSEDDAEKNKYAISMTNASCGYKHHIKITTVKEQLAQEEEHATWIPLMEYQEMAEFFNRLWYVGWWAPEHAIVIDRDISAMILELIHSFLIPKGKTYSYDDLSRSIRSHISGCEEMDCQTYRQQNGFWWCDKCGSYEQDVSTCDACKKTCHAESNMGGEGRECLSLCDIHNGLDLCIDCVVNGKCPECRNDKRNKAKSKRKSNK